MLESMVVVGGVGGMIVTGAVDALGQHRRGAYLHC